ncbi:unnamed protein product [Absidia cylindrospora]
MGKATKPKEKYQIDPKNISKHAKSLDPEMPSQERMEAELHLLKLRKQAIASSTTVSKPSKSVIKKKAVNLKKQKKTARAMLVADKEEARIQRTSAKQELRKVRKRDWIA